MFLLVTGEVNFCMGTTSVTVGAFNQPGVTHTLIDQPGSIKQGLHNVFFGHFQSHHVPEMGPLKLLVRTSLSSLVTGVLDIQ